MTGQLRMPLRHLIASLALLCASALSVLADSELLMIEQQGCHYCARWNQEVAHKYPQTAEGRAAPLRRLDIHDPLPADLSFEDGFHFTPTFVLMVDGTEVSRLEGYPGEDFFWGLLARMMTEARVLPAAGG
ncbi:hypothetical protein R5H30_12240 [Sulfitobacter sp. D35]|uniref:hypothetical protein n=1 Tax=Sulfitobacter sp. D35 TaxID=3083252 RepID=UPI00296E511B|nr:hypothetical protein [Sulfitobacter sp. D35]MDW4498756.1 hypothetical protein [Sulfitobacter sp. D35]